MLVHDTSSIQLGKKRKDLKFYQYYNHNLMSPKYNISELIQNKKNVKIHNRLNYFFRNDLILAHTPNICLVGTNNFDGSHLFKNMIEFKKICKLNDAEIDSI
jgi:hypothetical protein